MRTCVICGARVRNMNPKTRTCSPDCTAKLHGRPAPEVHFCHCRVCGLAIERGDLCQVCRMDLDIERRSDENI